MRSSTRAPLLRDVCFGAADGFATLGWGFWQARCVWGAGGWKARWPDAELRCIAPGCRGVKAGDCAGER
eukprot:11086458-Alexandrium_andersonii.AAC.1